ncbi:MAG: hypothetical protein ACKVIR_01490 [Candidatus Poseidoniales archaeon]
MEDKKKQGEGLLKTGGYAALFSLFMFMFGSDGAGFIGCFFAIIMLFAGAIAQSSAAVSAAVGDGKMVLQQAQDGQWAWVQQGGTENPVASMAFNDQNNQILSRVISEVRNGSNLESLESSELKILAQAYGVDAGSEEQKILSLQASPLAAKALKLGAGAAIGAAAIGGATMISKATKAAKEKQEAVNSTVDEFIEEIEQFVPVPAIEEEDIIEEEVIEEEVIKEEIIEEVVIEEDVIEEDVIEEVVIEEVVIKEDIIEEVVIKEGIDEEIELSDGIDTPLEHAIQSLDLARLSSERKVILDQLSDKYSMTVKISKIERTLLGEASYRGGTSLHGLIDGGPFSGLIQLHVDIEEHGFEIGDNVLLRASLEDYRSSLKRAVLKVDSIQG